MGRPLPRAPGRRGFARIARGALPALPSILALAVYSPALLHRTLWDDALILDRQLPGLSPARAFAPPPGLFRWTYSYYRPVTTLSFLLDRWLYGPNLVGYHASVWLLHALAALAVFLLASRLLPRSAALLAACLFAVFPLHPECVGWIAGRTDILATLFAVLSGATLLFALSGAAPPGTTASAPIGRRAGQTKGGARGSPLAATRALTLALAAGVLFLLALLSKESAVAVAPFLLAAGWIAGARGGKLLVPIGVVALPISVYLILRTTLDPGAATEPVSALPVAPVEYLMRSAAYVHAHLVIPVPGPPYIVVPPDGPVLAGVSILLLLGAILAGCVAWMRGARAVPLGIIWTLGGTGAVIAASVSGLSRTPVADRYFYFPAVGFCWLLALAIASLAGRSGRPLRASIVGRESDAEPARTDPPAAAIASVQDGSSRHDAERDESIEERATGSAGPPALRRIVSFAAGWVLVAVFALASYTRLPLYADDLAFWSAATAADPALGAAWINLGYARGGANDLDGAESAFSRGLALPLSGADRALALSGLGTVFVQRKDLARAEPLLREAATHPESSAVAKFNLGALLFHKGVDRASRTAGGSDPRASRGSGVRSGPNGGGYEEFVEAAAWLQRAVRQDPWYVKAWLILGDCYANVGERERARQAFRQVLEIEGPRGASGREAALALQRLG